MPDPASSLLGQSARVEPQVRDIVAAVGFLYGDFLPEHLKERLADVPDDDMGRLQELLRLRCDWRCECGDLNRAHEAFCYRCGAGSPEDD